MNVLLEKFTKKQLLLGVLAITHTVGVVGYLLESKLVIALTPINLLVTCLVLFSFLKLTKAQYLIMLVIYVLGFLVEASGVHFGQPFGDYSYSNILGFKLIDTPLIIGINWLILVLCVLDFVSPLKRLGRGALVFIASLTMVALDFFIEIVAIKYNWWQWDTVTVPLQNYFGWFIVSLVMFQVAYKYSLDYPKHFGRWVLLIQFIFFVVLGFFG
ncbi:MAG: carotenoid biosynthesis protein [Luteibaculaceae bacterium]